MNGLMISIRTLMAVGRSRAITIPVRIQRALEWQLGDAIAVGVEDGRLVARKVDERELIRKPEPGRVEALMRAAAEAGHD